MGNTKNFIVEGPLEVGTTVVSNKGTVTTSTVSSLPDATYTNNFFISGLTQPFGLTFKPDGTKAYITTSSFALYSYALSTAWDITTASNDATLLTSGESLYCYDVAFKPDGTKMYIIDGLNIDSVYQYSLSTAWDITTASYDSVSLDVSSKDTLPYSLAFNSAGTKLYVTGLNTSKVYEYSLSTAWDLSTASYTGNSLSVSAEDTNIVSVRLNSDDTKLYTIGAISDTVYEYTMSTAGDISTATYSGNSFDPTSQEPAPWSMYIKPDDLTMYLIGTTQDRIYEYSLSVSSINCDLSTGNVFDLTTDDANVIVTFSNPSNAQSFSVEATSEILWDLNSLDRVEIARNYNGQFYDYFDGGSFLSRDGTRFFHNSRYYQNIITRTFPAPFDTAGNFGSGATLDYGTNIVNGVHGFYIRDDGAKMFVTDIGAEQILRLNLSTDWDIGTASTEQSFTVQYINPTAVTFKPDGTEMYTIEYDNTSSTNYRIVQYSLTTAWDLSTASYTGNSEIQNGYNLTISDDGINVISSISTLFKYVMSTPWDITTLSSYTQSASITAYTATSPVFATFVSYDGRKVFSLEGDNSPNIKFIVAYDMIGSTSLTWPTSIEWQNGVIPTGLEKEYTSVYSFSTTDGGTTYKGVKSLSNLS